MEYKRKYSVYFPFRSIENLKYIKASRLQNLAKKQLLEASKVRGQTKLSFVTQSETSAVVDDNPDCTISTTDYRSTDAREKEASSFTQQSSQVVDPWIEATNSGLYFTPNVKRMSENKVDIFKRSGLMIISGYGITEEKRQHFVEYALCSNSLTIPRNSSTMTEQLVFKTGKKAKKD